MAFTDEGFLSRKAAADLSTKKNYIVKLDASGNVVLAAAATDAILGVLANAPKLNDTADVALVNGDGTFLVVAGGTITKDAYLTTNSSGQAIATTSAGDRVIGRALTAAVTGDVLQYVKSNEKY